MQAARSALVITVMGLLYAGQLQIVGEKGAFFIITAGEAAEQPSPQNLASSRQDLTTVDWRPERLKIEANIADAPDGTKTATRLSETTDSGFHRIETTLGGTTPGALHTLSLLVKPEQRNAIQFEMRDLKPGDYGLVRFDVTQKSVVFKSGNIDASGVEALPNGWFRCWASMPFASDIAVFNFALMDNANATSYAGTSGSGLLIADVQFNVGGPPENGPSPH
jgi:hypothetical protein